MTPANAHTSWITTAGGEGSSGPAGARFPYWSFTKTVIAICAMKLVESAALDLDKEVSGARYTLRQLLNHTSGLPDYAGLPAYRAAVAAHETPWSRDRMLDLSLASGMLFEPGSGWSYSNIGYMFVVELLEETTGRPLREIVAETVCKPLGLGILDLTESREQFGRLVPQAAMPYDPKWVYHGCLSGTVPDAARLLHGLMTGAVLRPETLRQMLVTTPVGGAVPGRPWTRHGYALGLMSGTMGDRGRAVGHSGGGPSSVNAVYHFTDGPDPITVAAFVTGPSEGVAEYAAVQVAADR